MEELLLRPTEVASSLKLSRSKVYELLSAGVLPSIRIGGSIRVSVSALKEYIASQEVQRSAWARTVELGNRLENQFGPSAPAK